MSEPKPPPYEPAHVRALRWTNRIELPHPRVGRLVGLARKLFAVPVALVIVPEGDGSERQFQFSPDLDCAEADAVVALCEDAPRDPRRVVLAELPDTGESGYRFYAGHRLEASDGSEAGTLCIADRRPRDLSSLELEVLSDLAEMMQSELQRIALETIDEETRLPNRRGFLFIGGRALALRDRAGEPVSLLAIEMRASSVEVGTPEHGYVLRAFARALMESFRDSDVVARLAEEDFCVLMSPERPDDVEIPLGRLSAELERWNRADDGRHQLDFRHRAIEFDPEEDRDLEGLMAAAEDAPETEPPPVVGGVISILRRFDRR